MSLHTMKDAAKALREQKKQKEAAKLAELESKFVLCETVYACGVAPCEISKTKRCPTCRTIAESGRACGKGKFGMLKTSAAAAATGGPGPDIPNQSTVPRQPLSPPLQRAWPAYDAEFA
ncbi:hypothetical protein T492DRAFT_897395 [Pavlovales sp. CCMP2436]|nr:hypothetical protein T492DRAFT_897395 [Pavlovales sp. CCMP2436]